MQNGNQFEETKKNTETSWKSNSSRKPQNLQNKRFMENFNALLASLEVRTQMIGNMQNERPNLDFFGSAEPIPNRP